MPQRPIPVREESPNALDRRSFIKLSGGAIAGLTLGGLGCSAARERGAGAEAGGVRDDTTTAQLPFPSLEVSGEPRECGRQIGKTFATQIKQGLERRAAWFGELRRFMQADLKTRYEPYLAAGRQHFPDVVAELEGWAEGSGVDFKDLVALNLKAELGAMMDMQDQTPGCSTLSLSHGDQRLLVHNEDGGVEYADLMFFLKVSQPGKPTFFCLSYPGILPGNAPGWNAAGLVLTTNYIPSAEWKEGVPRYFLDRAVLDCHTIEQALEVAQHPARAFGFHFNLASIPERRLLSVETSVHQHEVHEVDGLYVHTNHLILPKTREAPQDQAYIKSSSNSRYRVLSAAREAMLPTLDQTGETELVAALSSHDGKPYSPCRHPEGEVTGMTLANSVFDVAAGSWAFYKGNPCEGTRGELPPFERPTLRPRAT